jgi:hypothetical protein
VAKTYENITLTRDREGQVVRLSFDSKTRGNVITRSLLAEFHEAIDDVSARKPRVSMLPAFDEYTVGYRDRSMLVAETRSHRAISLLGPVIVVDGLVVGNWKRTLTRERVTVETHLSRPMTRPEGEALASAAREYGEFLGMEAILKRK